MSQNTSSPVVRILATLGACSFLLLACRAPTQRVEVPAGFTGPVRITCTRLQSDPSTLAIDRSGTLLSATCPTSTVPVLVLRDGQPITSDVSPHWTTTGDGVVLGLELTVR